MFLSYLVACICGTATPADSPISVFPAYTSDDVIADERCVGTWQVATETASVQIGVSQSVGKSYNVAVSLTNQDGVRLLRTPFRARIFRLADRQYIDITSETQVDLSSVEDFDPLQMNGHLILEYTVREEVMTLSPISYKRLINVAGEGGFGEIGFVSGGRQFFAIPTLSLRKLIESNWKGIVSESRLKLHRKIVNRKDE